MQKDIDQAQPTLQSFLAKEKTYDKSSVRKKELDKLAGSMICTDFLPLSIVEKQGFVRFVKALDPKYVLPSRKHLQKTLLPDLHNGITVELQRKLRTSSDVALTTDLWTSCSTESYMGVTAHYWDETANQLEAKVLACTKFEGKHTALALKTKLEGLIEDFGITEKIVAILSDNAANIQKALEDMNVPHLGCFAHSINLVATYAVNTSESMSELRKKVTRVVALTKKSTSASEAFEECQKRVGMKKTLRLKQDVPTRWNSTYDMFSRFLQLKDALNLFICEFPAESLVPFRLEEWQTIEAVTLVLKPLLDVTEEISVDKYPSVSKVVPLTKLLLNFYSEEIEKVIQITIYSRMNCSQNCSSLQTEANTVSRELCQNVLLEVRRRFFKNEEDPIYGVAAFLDPRFKKFAFMSSQNAFRAMRRIKRIAETDSSLPTEPSLTDNEYEPPQVLEIFHRHFNSNFNVYCIVTEKDVVYLGCTGY